MLGLRQELRINHMDPSFPEVYAGDVKKYIFPVVRKHWHPVNPVNLRMPFVIKYTLDTQTSMKAHHDSCLLSIVVRLNDGYEGGKLCFPRQNWDNQDIPVGNVVIFPSMVTHVHKVTDLIAGTRYSFTGWITGRNSNYGDEIQS